VLKNVGVEAVFLGPAWASDPALVQQSAQLDGFLQYLTGSSYLDMLGKAGYRVGRGTFLDGRVVPTAVPGTFSDAQIQGTLAASIGDGSLQAPDANRLYVVFVEPGVDVTTMFGDSATNVLGYHWAFQGPTGAVVNYAVVPYPAAPNAPDAGLSAFETVTKVASHEVAEAVTDPQGQQIGRSAWYDGTWHDPASGTHGGEIADISEHVVVDLGGYVVQGVVNRHDQPLLPAGGTLDARFPVPAALRHGRHGKHVAARDPAAALAGREPSGAQGGTASSAVVSHDLTPALVG
jgi:hypothetical protein